MKKTIKGIDEFHFKLDQKLKNDLLTLPVFGNKGNLSGIIVKILGYLSEKLDSEHLSGEQRKSRYGLVNEDLQIERESVHVYLPESLYRKLKLMHQDLNFYSIAQLLRWLIRYFIDLARVYGDKIEVQLAELTKEWKNENDTKCFSGKMVRQLLMLTHSKQAKISLLNLYNDVFSPVRIFRI